MFGERRTRNPTNNLPPRKRTKLLIEDSQVSEEDKVGYLDDFFRGNFDCTYYKGDTPPETDESIKAKRMDRRITKRFAEKEEDQKRARE